MGKTEKTEKRFRVIGNTILWHDLFQCHVLPGEDYNMLCFFPDGRKWKYPDDIQTYLDSGMLEIYFAPVGTPHVVKSLGLVDHIDQETGEHRDVQTYTTAANQWAGESVFIEKYDPDTVVTASAPAPDEIRIQDLRADDPYPMLHQPFDAPKVNEWDRDTFPDTRTTEFYGAEPKEFDEEDEPDDYDAGKG